METTENPRIEWKTLKGTTCLYFTFEGIFEVNAAKEAIKKWEEEHDKKKNKKVVLVFNCSAMQDWHPMARTLWQNSIANLKNKIEEIWVVYNSPVIRAGAHMISLFTSSKVQIVKSEECLFL